MTLPGALPARDLGEPGSPPAPRPAAVVPAVEPAPLARPVTRPRPVLRRGLEQALGLLFAAAYVTCVVIEPVPDGPDPDPPLWTLPIDLLSLAAIVVACVALFRGSRRAPELGILAGLGMVAETVTCPVTGHHLLGSFVWTQTGLSAFVLLASTALVATRPVPRDG